MHEKSDIFQIFLEETDELLKTAEDCLLRLEAGAEPKSVVEELFRAMHTLKSGSALVGLVNLSSYVHQLEDLLEQVRNHRLPASQALVSLLLREVDFIRATVTRCSGAGQDADPTAIDAACNRLRAFLETAGVDTPGVADPLCQQPPATEQQARRHNSIRVRVEKIDRLLNLAEEIGISIARMQDLFSRGVNLCLGAIEGELSNLGKANQELQERINQVRMLPLEETFNRIRRLARDTACAQGKTVKVIMAGEKEELDKQVIEAIADPLKHLVRNCVDHGLELPAQRLAASKPAEGTIELRAFRRGGRIHILISDDGRGFDLEAIRGQALARGLAVAGEDFAGEALARCVCTPGFSTATAVTEISGRGVGMDVVKSRIERLGGELHIDTVSGRGTTFNLSLPLTLTLTEALHVQEQGISFLVPLLAVLGTEAYETRRASSLGEKGMIYRFAGEYLPLERVSRLFGKSAPAGDQSRMAVVALDTGSGKIAILVDEVLEPCQVVVKGLEATFGNINGIAGATIMGDGSVSLMLDLHGLADLPMR